MDPGDIDLDDAMALCNQHQCATNYFRLVQLTMIEGTNVVRRTILSKLRHNKTIHTILSEKKSEFMQKGSGFNRPQLDLLFPVSGNANLNRIDMTLWFALGRKLHVIPKSYMEDQRTAGDAVTTFMGSTQVEWCHDLATIHTVRNNLFHLVKPEIEMETFEIQWKRLEQALCRLDPSLNPETDFNKYRNAELNPTLAKEFQMMVKDQCLQEKCQDLTEDNRKQQRTLHIVLLILALLILVILASVLIFTLVFRQKIACDKSIQYRVIKDLAGLNFLPRNGWGAEPPSGALNPLHIPVPYVIYTHTAEVSSCSVTEECCNQVKNIQYLHMHMRKDRFFDIGYHFLIDNKGIIYEGRMPNEMPSAVKHWNDVIISVAFIGNFQYQFPTTEALANFDLLMAYLKDREYIVRNYTIYGMCECRDTSSPGFNLYDIINNSRLPHIYKHVRHRPAPNGTCFFNDTVTSELADDRRQQRPFEF